MEWQKRRSLVYDAFNTGRKGIACKMTPFEKSSFKLKYYFRTNTKPSFDDRNVQMYDLHVYKILGQAIRRRQAGLIVNQF